MIKKLFIMAGWFLHQ